MGEIGLGRLKPETVLLEYQKEHPDEEKISEKMMRRVLKNLAWIVDAARDALNDSVFTIDEYKEHPMPRT